jgi:hypothetical protein
MELATEFVQLLVSVVTLATVVISALVMFWHSKEAKGQRIETLETVKLAKESTETNTAKLEEVTQNMKVIETATNGMKDALVATTAKIAFDAGLAIAAKKESTSG